LPIKRTRPPVEQEEQADHKQELPPAEQDRASSFLARRHVLLEERETCQQKTSGFVEDMPSCLTQRRPRELGNKACISAAAQDISSCAAGRHVLFVVHLVLKLVVAYSDQHILGTTSQLVGPTRDLEALTGPTEQNFC